MTENQTPEAPAVEVTAEPSRKRKIVAVALSTTATVALTIVSQVAIEVASSRIKDAILKPSKTN